MGQRQRGGDGDAAGSRGAKVPTSPCPRGAELRGGDVQGPANLKPVPKSCFYCGVTIKRVLAGCCPRARSLLTVAVGCGEALGGSTRPHGDPQHRGAQGELSWVLWDSLGAVGSPFWGHGTPFLGPWVVVFLGSQPVESGSSTSTRAQDLGGPPGGALHPQKELGEKVPPSRGCRGGRRGSGAGRVGGAGGERGPPGAGRAALPGPCSRSHGAAHHSASSESYLRSWRISLIASMVLISLRERMETINKAHMERIIWAASRSPRCL